MNRITGYFNLLIVINLALAGLLPAQLTGPEILDKVMEVMNPPNAQAIIRQTIVTTTGQTRTFEFDSYVGNRGESSLMRYRSPSRVRGNAMLMTDFADNIWMYFKQTGRVRKLASHAKKQKFEGSDFTYEDMGSGESWKVDYRPENHGIADLDGQETYQLVLTAHAEDLSYSQMVCWVRTTDFLPLQIDYYDEDGQFTKVLRLDDIRVIEGIPTAMKMVMENRVDKTNTSMETVEITYDVTFDKNFFSERSLKK
ncbi:MAG: outer membrane lipoprotein-sorting protein [Candidatus Neomarinimicrobiota bacterium]